jgi:hypothetical protein
MMKCNWMKLCQIKNIQTIINIMFNSYNSNKNLKNLIFMKFKINNKIKIIEYHHWVHHLWYCKNQAKHLK